MTSRDLMVQVLLDLSLHVNKGASESDYTHTIKSMTSKKGM
jgi:hypothetical protein